MFQTKLVYLCGPISGLTFKGCNGWREYVKYELEKETIDYPLCHEEYGHRKESLCVPKFKCLNPMRGEEDFLGKVQGKIPALFGPLDPDNPLAQDSVQNARDTWDVKEADILFANFTGAKIGSLGTAGEMAIGWWLHKFVLMIAEPDNLHAQHGLLKNWASLILPTVEDGVAYLKEILYR